jgi:hypothetical protein
MSVDGNEIKVRKPKTFPFPNSTNENCNYCQFRHPPLFTAISNQHYARKLKWNESHFHKGINFLSPNKNKEREEAKRKTKEIVIITHCNIYSFSFLSFICLFFAPPQRKETRTKNYTNTHSFSFWILCFKKGSLT